MPAAEPESPATRGAMSVLTSDGESLWPVLQRPRARAAYDRAGERAALQLRR